MFIPIFQKHKKVIIIGGGESLKGFDFDQLKDFDGAIITINSVIYHIPRADYWITCDLSALQEGLKTMRGDTYYFAGYPYYSKDYKMVEGVHYLDKIVPDSEDYKLQEDKDKITGGVDSVYGALNLAYHMEAEEIVLLGVDCYGYGHWYDERSPYNATYERGWENRMKTIANRYNDSIRQFDDRKTKIINGSKDSVIRSFRRMDAQDAINCIL